VAKPEWGLKRSCLSCGTKYYDMKKEPPVCPNCGTTFDPEAVMKTRRRAAAASIPAADPRKVRPESEDDLDLVLPDADGDEDEEDALIEDADELGDDVDDVVDVSVTKDDDR
jgi:uncharacterized protein (TIGR02300 family)